MVLKMDKQSVYLNIFLNEGKHVRNDDILAAVG